MSTNPSAVPLVQGEPAAGTSGLTFPPPSLYSGSRRKKAKSVAASVTTYVRDIVCLPQSYCIGSEKVNIPRGERRSALAEYGLVGKVQFNSAMDALEVRREICAVFAEPMGLHESGETTVPFEYLQRTGAGSRSLCRPSVSTSFYLFYNEAHRYGTKKKGYV